MLALRKEELLELTRPQVPAPFLSGFERGGHGTEAELRAAEAAMSWRFPDLHWNLLWLFPRASEIRWQPYRQVNLFEDGCLSLHSSGADPVLHSHSLSFRAERFRYLILEASALAERPDPFAQLFFIDSTGGLTEERSLIIPLNADGRIHRYVIDLRAPGNGRAPFWHELKECSALRFDPLNCMGMLNIYSMVLTGSEAFLDEELRARWNMSTCRGDCIRKYISGSGIEIGALQNPLPLPHGTSVSYVDRFPLKTLRRQYPELSDYKLVKPDIIADAHELLQVAASSQDFCIANHVLEHMQDPIGALREWMRVLRPGGALFLAVNDYSNALDRYRKISTLEHMLEDHHLPELRAAKDREHYLDWARSVHFGCTDQEAEAIADTLINQDYAIHFHVFDQTLFTHLLQYLRPQLQFEITELASPFHGSHVEHIAVLTKV